jgi:hypothetical protein
MKKLLLVLAVPFVLFGGVVKQEYVFTTPLIQDGSVSLDGCHQFYAPFVPQIPAKSVRLLLPDGEKAVSFDVSYENSFAISGSHVIRPYHPEFRIGAPLPPDSYLHKSSVYAMNAFFPGKVKSDTFEVQYKGGHPIFMAQIYPVHHNPVTGAVRYFRKIIVTVHTEKSSEQPVAAVKTTPMIKEELSKLVDNPAGIAKMIAGPVTANDYEYLVITTAALSTNVAWDTLTAFNKRRGMRTKIVSVSTILTSMTGADNQEKIRNYIRQQYLTCNINYVLLSGDADSRSANIIPARGLYAEDNDYNYRNRPEDHYTDNIPADMYYGCLDTAPHDWHKDANGHWGTYGTEDKTFEVYVGRWSTDDATQLSNILNKTIKYSEHPVDSFCTRALLAGEFLWGPGNASDPHVETCYGDDELEQIIGTCTSPSYAPYTTVGFPSSQWAITKLYAHVVGNWQDVPPAFSDTLKRCKASIIDHEGHSNTTFLWGESWTTSRFPQNCTPANGNCFVAMSGGCYPGCFDDQTSDCVAEQLTTTLATGAVACIFNARYGFGSDGTNNVIGTDGSEQRLRRYFHNGLFALGYHNIERLNAYTKEVNAGDYTSATIGWTNPTITGGTAGYNSYWGQLKWETYEKNVLGDPALSIWTAKPQAFTVTLPNPLSTTAVTLSVPKYSTVALADPTTGNIIVSATSDSSSSLTINNTVLSQYLLAHTSGTLKVFIKAHNFYPYAGTMNVSIGSGILEGGVVNQAFSATMRHKSLAYSLVNPGAVSIDLFNARGAVVKSVARDLWQAAGPHSVSFETFGLSNGTYFCKLNAGGRTFVGKFILAR